MPDKGSEKPATAPFCCSLAAMPYLRRPMPKARIIKSTGSWYTARLDDGRFVEARTRGKMRQAGSRSTNPVAVGDLVQLEGDESGWAIGAVEPRHNYIVRRSVNLSKESHIIAANLDQAILVATMREPTTFPVFIDRFCVAAEAFHIPVVLVFNKIDLLDDEERALLKGFLQLYTDLGYSTFACSADSGEGVAAFRQMMQGRVSLLSGHSGVGKSSLINAVAPGLGLRIGAVSSAHGTGQHTTTFAEMHELDADTFIVDTPGIRGFGLVDIARDELAGYFPEMRHLLPHCKFYNCLHINEPGCAVKAALDTGEVAETRYRSYLNMYENDKEDTYR